MDEAQSVAFFGLHQRRAEISTQVTKFRIFQLLDFLTTSVFKNCVDENLILVETEISIRRSYLTMTFISFYRDATWCSSHFFRLTRGIGLLTSSTLWGRLRGKSIDFRNAREHLSKRVVGSRRHSSHHLTDIFCSWEDRRPLAFSWILSFTPFIYGETLGHGSYGLFGVNVQESVVVSGSLFVVLGTFTAKQIEVAIDEISIKDSECLRKISRPRFEIGIVDIA